MFSIADIGPEQEFENEEDDEEESTANPPTVRVSASITKVRVPSYPTTCQLWN